MKDIAKKLKTIINEKILKEFSVKIFPIKILYGIEDGFYCDQVNWLKENFIDKINFEVKREYRLDIFQDETMYDLIKNECKEHKKIGSYRVFREHTQSEIHQEYEVDGISVFTAEHWKKIQILKISENNIIILARDFESLKKEYAVYVAREILNKSAEMERVLLIHSAAISIDGKGAIFTGMKGAGKTTALCNIASSDYNCKVISNDRTFVDITEENLKMQYYPMNTRIGWGTVKRFKHLEDFLIKKYKKKCIRKAKLLIDNTECKTKYSITKDEFQQIFNKEMATGDELTVIIIPQIKIGSKVLRCSCVEKERAVEVLLKNNFTPNDDLFIDEWLVKRVDSKEELEEFARKSIDEIVSRIPVIKIEYGTDVPVEKVNEFFINEIMKERKS